MKITKLMISTAALTIAAASQAIILNPGDIAFTGFNADGTDGYSFVALTSVGAGEQIFFTDDEWNGSAWADSNEATWSWTAPIGGLVPGTVVSAININNLYTGTPAPLASSGSIAAISDSSNNSGISTTADTIYAYIGTRTAPTLIAAISSDIAVNFGGLTGGAAVKLTNGIDSGKYIGSRAGATSFASYLSPIGTVNATNWVQSETGDNNFDLTPFTIVPEPGSFLALGLGAAFLLRRKK